MAVRDFLNEGGKLVLRRRDGRLLRRSLGAALGGIYYGLDGAPEEECVVTASTRSATACCSPTTSRSTTSARRPRPRSTPAASSARAGDRSPAQTAPFGGPATVGQPGRRGRRVPPPTSDVLDPDEFPQFGPATASPTTSTRSGRSSPSRAPARSVAAHADDSYMRLGRTFDLTGVTRRRPAAFEAQLSFDVEDGYDHVIVEARTVGQDDWTTLPDLGGATTSDVPAECEAGFLLEEHPNLLHYLTLGRPVPRRSGTTGTWNSFTGSSGGWVPVAFDLSAYAGQQVELVVSYVTDPFTGGTGVMLDDTAWSSAAGATEAEGFEAGLGAWAVLGAPAGSPGNAGDWELTRRPRPGIHHGGRDHGGHRHARVRARAAGHRWGTRHDRGRGARLLRGALRARPAGF